MKNYRKARRRGKNVNIPYAKRLMAKLGNQAYKIVGNELRIPIRPKEYFYIKLHKRARKFLSDATLKLGSITLTACMISVVFKKTAEIVEPKGYVAFDTNEKSIDSAYIKDGKVFFKATTFQEYARSGMAILSVFEKPKPDTPRTDG